MRTATGWLGKFNLLKSTTVAMVAVAAIAGTALAAGPLGATAKKKCDQTCQETKLFNALYAAKIAKADVAFATAAGSAASAGSAGSASTAKTLTGTVAGAQVAGPVASASTAASANSALSAASAANLTGPVNGAQVAGAVASATTAGNVDGHTFTQIDAGAGIDEDATLLKEFGGLTLQCVPPPGPGTEGNVSLAIANVSSANGSFGVGEVTNGASHFEEGAIAAAVGGIPVTTTFTFPVHSGAQVNFSFKLPVGAATDMVSGAFTLVLDNGCSAFGNAQASVS
jgi:hypothetical protein